MRDAEKKRKQLLKEIAAVHARFGEEVNTVTPILYLSLEGTVLLINKAGERYLGGEADNFIGKKITELVPDISQKAMERIERAIETGTGGVFEDLIELPSRNRWFLTNVNVIKNTDGEAIAIEAMFMDVTRWKAIEDRSNLLSEVIEQSSEGIAVINMDGYLLFVNEAFAAMHGYKTEELSGKHLSIFHSPEQMPTVDAANKQTIETGQFIGEIQHVRRDGSVFPTLMRNTVLQDEAGNKVGMIGTLRDITDQKKAEEALRESERDKSLILGSLSELISYQDKSLKVIWANKAAGDSVGLAPEELIGRYCYEIWHRRQEPCPNCPVQKSMETGRPEEGEMTSQDGRVWYVKGRPVLNEQGEVIGAVEITLEITDRKRAAEALRKSENLLQTVIDSTKDAMISIGEDGLITLFNPAAEEMFGRTREEMIGKSVDCLMPEEYQLHHQEYVESYFSTGKPDGAIGKVVELPGLHRNGTVFPMAISLSPGMVDGKRFVIAVVRDITERKQAEENLRRSEERFRNIFENTTIGIYRTTPDGRILMANPALVQMLGFKSFDELAKRNLEEEGFEPGYPRSVFKQRIEREGQVVGMEFEWTRRDGVGMFIRENAKRIADKDGTTLYYEGTIEDITERKRAEEELRIKDKAIESSISAIAIAEPGGNLTYVNPAFLKMWGYDDFKDVIGKPAIQFWQFEDLAAEVVEALHTKGKWTGEMPAKTKDGTEFDVQIMASVVKTHAEKPLYIMASFIDITERKGAEKALQASVQKHKTLVENIPGMVYRAHPDWSAVIISGCEETCGYTEDELNSREGCWLSIIHPDDMERALEESAGLIKERKSIVQVYRIIAKSGENRWVEDHKTSLFSQEGRFVGIDGIVFDITERKRAEEELQKEKDFRNRLVQASPAFFVAIDAKGKTLMMNEAMLDAIGYTEKEVVGKDYLSTFVPEDDREALSKVFEKLVGTAEPTVNENRVLTKDGRGLLVEWRGRQIFKPDGQLDFFFGVGRDITESRKAQLGLEHMRKFERLITDISGHFINISFEQIDEGINQALRALGEFAGVDRSYIFQFFDGERKISNTHEWRAEGIAPQIDNLQNLSVDTVPWWMGKLEKFENIYIPDVEKLPARAKNEKQILQAQSIQSLIVIPMVHNRRLVGFVGFDSVRGKRAWSEESIAMLTIVSEIFTNALMRRRIQQEVDSHYEKMRRAEQLASLGTISATIAHELNQPLTVIRLFLQQGMRALKDDNDINRVETVIKDCLTEVTKAADTVDRFRRFARKASPVYIAEMDLVEVVYGTVGILTESARRKKLDLSVIIESYPPHIVGNSIELEQVFFVLIQNAIQAADGETRRDMKITISSADNEVQLTFADTCGGIEQENIDKIFEPFFTTKPADVGTGLGLCILERIIKRYGGSVRVESQFGHGTIFYISLPVRN